MTATRNQGPIRHRYLQLSDLRRLEYLLFAPRRLVEGRFSGHYTTRQRGQSVEFRDYREYLPGDEIGGIDWKVYGRSDKLFLKLYEHQSELTVHLLVDASGSMAYRGSEVRPSGARHASRQGPPSKYDYSCSLAASLGFLVMKQHDRFSFAIAQKGLQRHLPAESTMRHLTAILKSMEQIRPRDAAGLAGAIDELTRVGSRRSLLIVFSDLIDDPAGTARALAARIRAGGEAIVFHVLHPDEINLPDFEHGVFIDSESGAQVRLNVDDVRELYQQRMQSFLADWQRRCRGLGIDYARCSMAEPYYTCLERYLVGRGQRRG